jgi:glycosyltransferase involved in cell wall biosynthesis
MQELSFSANAAKTVLRSHLGAAVLSREIECAHQLTRRGYAAVFLELHRVPDGGTRRAWLHAAAQASLGVVAISGGVRDDLLALGVDAHKILVEHDAYESSRFANPPTRAEARRKLGLDPAARVVVYTGGLLEWKGVDLLVDAARELNDVTIVIAGGMEADVARLRGRAAGQSHVRIDGFQPPERVVDYLVAADVAVVPNRSQPAISARYTSPLKLFEAMALGVPLVAADVPSLRELLTHGEDAWLVAPDDAGALAQGLRKLLDDARLRAAIAKRFRSRAPQHTWDARAQRILSWMAARGA